MSKLNWWKMSYAVLLVCAATVVTLPAQTFRSLASFDGANGENPYYMSLVQGGDGNLYGTSAAGGAPCFESQGCGTVFKIGPSGSLKTVYDFCSQTNCADGTSPFVGLALGADGNFYGTTEYGGLYPCHLGCGTIFKITPGGTLTTLHSFDGTDGKYPNAAPVQGADGSFYGTTAEVDPTFWGTVFKMTSDGTLTTLYNFCVTGICTDGGAPLAALVQGTDGDFYGTTSDGGTNLYYGTVFRITPSSELTTLYSFCSQPDCKDGASPQSALIQAADGNFYGTTSAGGARGEGTVFGITPSGTLTTLYSFCQQKYCPDGSGPLAALVQGSDGNFYGTTSTGGVKRNGTIFEITPRGVFSTLHSFHGIDGTAPYGGLVQSINGAFYGTTFEGGTSSACLSGCGTVFSLSVGLGPFVETVPASGKVGAVIRILGTNLTGVTSVTFNGIPATFTVASGSLIKATVPAGATTGTVQVVTAGGTLSSNVPFTLVP